MTETFPENPIFKRNILILFSLIFVFQLLASAEMHAQIPGMQSETEAEEPEWPEDALKRRTPRGSVAGFISAVADKNYDLAGEYFKIPEGGLEDERSAELARELQILLNQRGQMMPYSWLSKDIEGRLDDDLPNHLERVGTISSSGEDYDILLEKVEGPLGGPLWLFSDQTVQYIEELSVLEENVLLLSRIMPPILERYELWGATIGQWLAILLLAAFSYVVAWLIIHFFLYIIPLIWKRARTEPTAGVLKALSLPVKLYLAVWLFVMLSQEIGISIILRQRFSGISIIIGLLAFLILLWRLSEFLGNFSTNRMSSRGNLSGVSVALFLKRAAKIAIIIFGIIAVLGTIGVDVTTGLAALGIGGIALALGAQKTIENFVGSVTLITDQPIRVGDFCKVGDTVGTVEKVGMRSTRIRTLARTVVTIPNGEFSSSKIENYAHRDKFWFNTVIGLRYETTPDQIRYLLVELRSILYAHPIVTSDTTRVRFIELGSDSINLEIFTYIKVSTYDEYLEVKEDLLLRIMDVVGESGTGFAFPSQTIYFGKDTGLSKEKSKTAEEKVRQWKEKGDLQLPKFDPEHIKEIEDKIQYPPEGSAEQKSKGTGTIPGL
ncbi:mechanosensitive ion channel family protein [Salinimicrobium sediminilitoris]|uniref:mechanosensitive ion channel family protein n=1 Tax=Salinimicrobium sediminilitoris TaxID=2876715 RepID=UPI001E44AFB7|nr:mechanosensitive ion channel family protein [Salinimicrobium sediminilitoris]MCC8360699.1 mechanosensitive ion channel family protein [Salinimicrobium sediminilitoris]